MTKEHITLGTDIELAAAMISNINELIPEIEKADYSEEKKAAMIKQLKFTKGFIESFANQL